MILLGFPGGTGGKESACNAGDIRGAGSIPGLGRPLEVDMATLFCSMTIVGNTIFYI